jgi:putative aldouronate transport system substrate-binding protein
MRKDVAERKRNVVQRILVLALSFVMLFTLAACNVPTNDSQSNAADPTAVPTPGSVSTEEPADAQKIEKVTLYPGNSATPSGLVEGYKAKIFAERGLEVEVWAFSDERTNAILASGDLPDVMYIDYERLVNMIEGGLVLDLEPYLDQIPSIVKNPDIQTALNYTRQFWSADTGKIYGLPTEIGIIKEGEDTARNAVKVNWPVYYDLGCPEVESFDDLIPLMKKMMEAKPVADDGTKTWGTILNSGSDGSYWGNMQIWYRFQGYNELQLPYLIETDMINEKYYSILELGKDSAYYKGLQWYNKAYREGVMDPDSINNDRESQKAKVEKSKACMVPSGTLAGWAGYRPIYVPGQKLNQEIWDSPYGRTFYLVVNSKTKNLEASLRLLDTFADAEAFFQIWTGTEEEGMWEYGPDGKIVPTQYGIDAYVKSTGGQPIYFTNGEELKLWNDSWIVKGHKDIPHLIGPDGQPRDLRGMGTWVEIKAITDNSEDAIQWRESMGFKNFTALLKEKNAFTLVSGLDFVNGFASAPDDVMKLTLSAIKDVVTSTSWKMVYAKTDAEFEALWDQMIKDCKDLGAEEIVQWRMDDLEKALQTKNSLAAK